MENTAMTNMSTIFADIAFFFTPPDKYFICKSSIFVREIMIF